MATDNIKIQEWANSQRSIILNCVGNEKPAVIRQSLVSLTEEPCSAVILDQLLYEALSVQDFELFVAEEKRASLENRVSFYHGWFSKSAQELLEDSMLTMSVSTLRRYLSILIKRGWVQTRKSSQNKGTRTPHYRVNLKKLCSDLYEHGYHLPDFAIYETLSPSEQSQNQLERAI